MRDARFAVSPRTIVPHRGDRSFIGQDAMVEASGDILLVCHWGREPARFDPGDPEYTTPSLLGSRDGGRSWYDAGRMPLRWNLPGYLSDGGVSLLCTRTGRIVFVSHRCGTTHAATGSHGIPVVSTSDDQGRSWTPARLLENRDDEIYVMNQRLVSLSTGRLVLAVSFRDPDVPHDRYGEGSSPCAGGCYLSDDDGDTWQPGTPMVRQEGARGVQEPCIVESAPGRLLMLFRGGKGHHQACWSSEGQSWSEPRSTTLQAACSPLTVTKLRDGRLMVAYNPAQPRSPESYFPRRPLAYALSDDGGLSWSEPVVIDDMSERQLIYPSITELPGGRVLVAWSTHFDPGDDSFRSPPDAWRAGGARCCVLSLT